MRRRSLTNVLSNEELNLNSVWAWYQFQRIILGEEKDRALSVPLEQLSNWDSRYAGLSIPEVDDYFDFQVAELGRCAMLGMLASTEAALRIDFIKRVRERKKDATTRAFRSLLKTRGLSRIRLLDDILLSLKTHADDKTAIVAIANFEQALSLRHWLAHGRYWKPRSHHIYNYNAQDIFDICNALLEWVCP